MSKSETWHEYRTRLDLEIVRAARALWLMHRPCAYSVKEHLDNPAINATTDAEKRLFKAVAAREKAK